MTVIIEFDTNLNYGLNIIKYRSLDDDNWYYMYIDIETLCLLLQNFGLMSTVRIPTKYICLDTPDTGREITVKYCGAEIKMVCGSHELFESREFNKMEENY